MCVLWRHFLTNGRGMHTKVTRWPTLCVLLVLMASYSQAQDVPESPDLDVIRPYFEASTRIPLIGEPFTITVYVELPPGSDLVEFPEFGDQWGDFEIRQRSQVENSVIDNGWTQYRQTLSVIIWDIGDFETPETLVGYIPADVAEIFYAPFNPIFITVPSVLDPDMNRNELKPLKPQITFFELSPWALAVTFLVIVSVLWLAHRWWLARKNRKIAPAPPPTPAEIALDQLRLLRAEVELPKVTFTQAHFYEELTEIMRAFVIAKFRTASPDLTTTEFIKDLRGNAHLDEKLIAYIESVLYVADDVKFGNLPAQDDFDKLVTDAARWVRAADHYMDEVELVQESAAQR